MWSVDESSFMVRVRDLSCLVDYVHIHLCQTILLREQKKNNNNIVDFAIVGITKPKRALEIELPI